MSKHSWIIKNGKQICKICGCVATHEEPKDGKYTGCIIGTLENKIKRVASDYRVNEFDVLFTFCGFLSDMSQLKISPNKRNQFFINMSDDFGTVDNAFDFFMNKTTLDDRFIKMRKK